jgi:flagellin-like protein
MNMRRSNKRGIVGIEAAIVLIAFVIVAAAFAFMVVNMGLTSTEKSKEAIQQGLKEASCPLTLDGSMLLKSESANNVSTIIIPLKTLGVKYVPMWTNETVVSIKIGTRVSVANIYSGINHTIDPSGMAFDSILNLLPKAYVASESIEIKDETGLLKAPIVPGTITITVSETTILKDKYANGTLYNMTDPSNPTLIGSINYDTGVISGLTGVKDGTYQATYRFGSAATLVIENDNHDDSLDFFEKGYLIITLHPHQRVFPRDNVLIEVRPEKSAPLTIEFTVPEAIPANAYVTIE